MTFPVTNGEEVSGLKASGLKTSGFLTEAGVELPAGFNVLFTNVLPVAVFIKMGKSV